VLFSLKSIGKLLGKKKSDPKPVDPDKWYPGKLLGKPVPESRTRTVSSSSQSEPAVDEYEYRESEHLMSVRRGKM